MKKSLKRVSIVGALACALVLAFAGSAFAATTSNMAVVSLNSTTPSTSLTKWVAPGDTYKIVMQALMAPMTLEIKDSVTGQTLFTRTVQPNEAVGPTIVYSYTQPAKNIVGALNAPRKLQATYKLPTGASFSSVTSTRTFSVLTVKPFTVMNNSQFAMGGVYVDPGKAVALCVTSDAPYYAELYNVDANRVVCTLGASVPQGHYSTVNAMWKNAIYSPVQTMLKIKTGASSNVTGELLIY